MYGNGARAEEAFCFKSSVGDSRRFLFLAKRARPCRVLLSKAKYEHYQKGTI